MSARIDPDKIDQLVVAVLKAVDERLGVVRKQFQGLIDATNAHRVELEEWQRALETREAALRAANHSLESRIAALEHQATNAAPAVATPANVEHGAPRKPVQSATQSAVSVEPTPAADAPAATTSEPLSLLKAVAPPAPLVMAPVTGSQPATATAPVTAPVPITSSDGDNDLDVDELARLLESRLSGLGLS